MNHTPGPWIKEGTDILGATAGIAHVATVNVLSASETKANAALIAAAPDMLDTLVYLEAILGELSEETFFMELNRIRLTIAATKQG